MSILSFAIEKVESLVDSIAPSKYLSGMNKQAALVEELVPGLGVTRRDLLENRTFREAFALNPRRTKEQWAEMLKPIVPDAGLGSLNGSWNQTKDDRTYDTRPLVTPAQLKHGIRIRES